jgi:hypothetical protein
MILPFEMLLTAEINVSSKVSLSMLHVEWFGIESRVSGTRYFGKYST